MKETITDIIALHEGGEEGFLVETTKQQIKLVIDAMQGCCEDWGFFWCNDKPKDFIGAELREITLTDTALETKEHTTVYEGGIMFVNLVTDRGILQFVAYNEHNGYYGHEARVESTQLEHSEVL